MKVLQEIHNVFQIKIHHLSVYREFAEIAILSAVSLALPVFVGHPQILVGILVNAMIVRASLTVKGFKILPVLTLPACGAILRGVLFGPFTKFLLYLFPFIWAGNLTLSYLTKRNIRKSMYVTIITSSIVKMFVIAIPAFLMIKLSIIPKALLLSMSLIQFITALVGASLALILTRIEVYSKSKN